MWKKIQTRNQFKSEMFSCLSDEYMWGQIHLIQTHESIILMYSFAFDGTIHNALNFYLFAIMFIVCTISIKSFVFGNRRHKKLRLEQIKRDQQNIIQIVGFRCDQRKYLREYKRKRSKITNQTIKCICLRKIQWENIKNNDEI